MKKYFSSVLGVLLGAALVLIYSQSVGRPTFGSAGNVTFPSTTMATSSVGLASWSTVLPAKSSRVYAIFCNQNAANGTIFLGLGATTTVGSNVTAGIPIPTSACYEMTLDKMFTGTVYAVASTVTSTLNITYAP